MVANGCLHRMPAVCLDVCRLTSRHGVRIEGMETPISTLYTNCHSVSSLTILLLFYVFKNKSTNKYMFMPLEKNHVFETNNSTYKKSQTSNINQN